MKKKILIIAIVLLLSWSIKDLIAIVRTEPIVGIWIGPPNQPWLILAKENNGGIWIGGFLTPPGPGGCDWAVALRDNEGLYAQYFGRLYSIYP